ncbi:MAG TPA: protein phosphatase [Pirellulales bacterium]|nr:protein phosphatase [Pirellulales bacterium]
MRQISPESLWIGNAFDARDLKSVLGHRLEAIIDLALEEPPIAVPRELIYCRFPLVDGQGNSLVVIEAAINTALLFVTARVPTLITCGGGMSRSPAIAAAVVARINHISPDEAMKEVAAEGPHDVAPLLWREVTEVLTSINRQGEE